MAEIILKNPAFKAQELEYYEFYAVVSIGGSGSCVAESISIPGMTITALGTDAAATIAISGFEAESCVAIDGTRPATLEIVDIGTPTGATAAEAAGLHQDTTAAYSGVAGSQVVTFGFDTTGAAIVFTTTDRLADALVRIVLPIKAKNF